MRLVLTIPDLPADPALAAELLRGVLPDLAGVADSIAAEIGPEVKPGQYGWTMDPDTHAVRVHWAARNDDGTAS
jgi:hypothetical protein